MPRRPDPTLKPSIIDKVVQHLRTTPLDQVSIRSLGRVLGTSAYPIVYHFGSKDALVEAVIDHLARRGGCLPLDADGDVEALADHLVARYGRLEDPDHELAARLAFELGAVESLAARTTHSALHREQVAMIAGWCRAHGATDAEATARDVVLAARGIQWGYLIDHDADAAEAALRRLAQRLAVDGGLVPAV